MIHSHIWDLGDVGGGLMTVLNIVVILPMSGQVLDCLRDYEEKMREREGE